MGNFAKTKKQKERIAKEGVSQTLGGSSALDELARMSQGQRPPGRVFKSEQ